MYNIFGYGDTHDSNGEYKQTFGGQMNFKDITMLDLGFTADEIRIFREAYRTGRGLSVTSLVEVYGLNYNTAKRIKYMGDIVSDRVRLEDADDLSKHLRRMAGGAGTIGMDRLALAKFKEIPRYAVVAGIKQSPYDIFNSKNNVSEKKVYVVESIYNGKVTVHSKVKPVLKFNDPKRIDGVLEIKDVLRDKSIRVTFEKDYVRMLNRFIVAGSLRKPVEHHGIAEIICIEGTKVYIYAQTLDAHSKYPKSRSTQRVYDYGIFGNSIKGKILESAFEMYERVCGVHATWIEGNSDYTMVKGRGCDNNDINIYNDIEM